MINDLDKLTILLLQRRGFLGERGFCLAKLMLYS